MTTDVLDAIKGLNDQLEGRFNDLSTKSDQAITAIEKGEQVAESLKSDILNAQGEIERVAEQVLELQQKGVKIHGTAEQKSFIDCIKEDDSVAAFNKGTAQNWSKEFDQKALTDMLEGKADTTNLRSETVDNRIITSARQNLIIESLLPKAQISSENYTYFREGVFTPGAAVVAEGDLKPAQNVTFTQHTDRVKKIAVHHPITMEQAQDYPQLQSLIRELLRYDLDLETETQILKGTGTGEDLNGLMTQATAFDITLAKTGDTAVDTIRRMIFQVRKQDKSSANAIVMSDKTWMDIELLKDANNAYLFANLQGVATPILWGKRVVVSDSMDDASEEILVANTNRAARLYDRMRYTVKVGMINDDFLRNQEKVLVERRLGLGVMRPQALVKHNLV